MKHYGSIQSYFHRVVDTTTIGLNTGANTTMGEENTTPVSKKTTAVPFSLDRDGIIKRILDIRDKRNCTNNEQFSQLIYGDKSHSKTIDKWIGKNSLSIPSIDSLAQIAHSTGVSLDWLVFGKEEPPAQDEVEKEDACNKEKIRTTPTVNEQLDAMKSEREGLEAMKNALIESLLNNDHPVLQACASFLNLLRYSNIFLEGDYDIDNIETPQCLTIRIIPKLFCTRGKYDNENLRFDCSFKNNRDSLLLVWDFRATLIQRFIALSLNWQERSCFNEKALLDSAFQFMIKTHAREHHSYKEFDCFGQNPAHGLLHYSIDDIFSKYVMIMQTYPYFSTTYDYESGEADPIRFTNYCDGEKVPSAIKEFGRYDNIC